MFWIICHIHRILIYNHIQDSSRFPYVRFALSAIRGDFSGEEHRVLLGLVQANLQRHDRELRGVGM